MKHSVTVIDQVFNKQSIHFKSNFSECREKFTLRQQCSAVNLKIGSLSAASFDFNRISKQDITTVSGEWRGTREREDRHPGYSAVGQ